MESRLLQSTFRLLNAELAEATALASIEWAVATFGSRLCLLSSMQDAVLIDLAVRVAPDIDVVFLDNGYHFEETLQTRARIERHYGIPVRTVGPLAPPTATVRDGACCDAKPALLEEALTGKRAWMSGIRRDETGLRAAAELVGVDRRGLTKVNPLAGWTTADAAAYIDANDVPTNPLLSRGYSSIGCATCTTPGATGREGRWAGSARVECGLHL